MTDTYQNTKSIRHGDGIIPYVAERIKAEPPAVDSLNASRLSRWTSFLGVDGGDLYDTDHL